MTITRLGIDLADSHCPRCDRMSLALSASGTSRVQPGYSRTSTLSSDGISERVVYRCARIRRCMARLSGCCRYWSSVDARIDDDDVLGDGAYSPKIDTV